MDLIRNNKRYCKIYTIHLQAVPQPWLIKYYASSAVVSGFDSNPHSKKHPPPSHMSKICFLNFNVLAYSDLSPLHTVILTITATTSHGKNG
jgi:hypothetical protein